MNIREYIKENKVLLFDGAMGTYYLSMPGCEAKRVEAANIHEPELVAEIHHAYLEAGCRAIKTNTFSVGADISQGEVDYAFRLIDAGCALAIKEANAYGAFVFADIGPAPLGGYQSSAENYITQAERFMANGVSCFLVETLSSDEGIEEFAHWLKENYPDSFLIVSYAVGPDGYTSDGLTGRELLERSCGYSGIDAVGVNCFMGPYHMRQYIENLPALKLPLSVMPNSGYPTVRGKHAVYGGTPEYFAENMQAIIMAGVSIVGGCCGTKPDHVVALGTAISQGITSVERSAKNEKQSEIDSGKSNALWDKLERGERIIAVEYDPPKNDNVSGFLAGVRELKAAGADAITIADCPVGIPRVDSSLMACKVKRELGIDVIPHMACRDRNLNAAKALLLGLSSEGVHNVLLITGDPMPSESRNEVKSVFNCNSRKLAKYVASLNPESLSVPFKMFGALNLNVRNFDVQLSIAKQKVENGISAFLTQPILSDQAMENLKTARRELDAKILAGIYPVVSYKNAVFMNNEIAGINVSNEICSMYEGLNREEAEDLAFTLSLKIAREAEAYTDGLYIMVPFNRTKLVGRIIKALQEKTK